MTSEAENSIGNLTDREQEILKAVQNVERGHTKGYLGWALTCRELLQTISDLRDPQ